MDLSRREAFCRLGLLGLSVAGAEALLAACGGDDDRAPATTTATSPPTGGGAPAGDRAEAITYPGPGGPLQGAYASPAEPKASVLVIHENRGLTPHFFDVVARLAADGYAALAVDLLSAQGGDGQAGRSGGRSSRTVRHPAGRLVGRPARGIDELERRHPGLKVGVVGFCYRNGMTWNLLNAGESRIAAAAPFYGPAPENADLA